jgi:hypothetical protein
MDDLNDPLTKYFSFIILGLVLCIGWIYYRLRQKHDERKQKKGHNLDAYLLEAEKEVRQKAKAKKQGLSEEQMNDVLAPTPDEEEKMDLIRHLTEEGNQSPSVDVEQQAEEPTTDSSKPEPTDQ